MALKGIRTKGVLTIWITWRTLKQWRECSAIGKLLGMRQDLVLARSLRLGKTALQRECMKKGLDWRHAFTGREKAPAAELDIDDLDDCPMIHE